MNITRRSMAAGAAAAALSNPGLGSAQSAPREGLMQLVLRTREARLAGNVSAWREGSRRTLALAPDHPDLLISAARASAASGLAEEAYPLLEDAARRGAGFDPVRFAEFAKLDFAGARATILERARANLSSVARGVRFADLLAPECEGVAYDPSSRRLFTGSADGRILAITHEGAVSTFAQGLLQVLGMKVDARRRLLWAVSGRYPNLFAPSPDPDTGYGGVRSFDIDTGRHVGAWGLDERPVRHGFNDLALARDGRVFITDSAAGSVYLLSPGAARFELLYQSDQLTFPNGIALTADERRLFVAHVEGLSVLNIERRDARRLRVPADAAVNSIDGLAWRGRNLIGVQNSPYFDRLVQIELDARGEAVTRVVALNARHPPEYSYTTCAVARDAIYVVGGSPAPNPYGGPPLAQTPAPHLLRVPFA